jgi:hypothetical protein
MATAGTMRIELAKPRVSGETKRKPRGESVVFLVARDRLEGGRGRGEGRGGKGTVGARKWARDGV